MNRALLNPFDLAELPKTIQKYLEEDKPSCMRFNRHGNLLGVGTHTGKVVIWDFDTRSIAAILCGTEPDYEYSVTSISFPAPHNASTVLVTYDPGMLRLFDTLSTSIVCEVIFDSPIVQVEAHPSIYNIALVVPKDSHPLQIHLHRGIYDSRGLDIRNVVHPDFVFAIPKATDQRDIPGTIVLPRKDLPKRPKHAFGNKNIPSLPNIKEALHMSVLCSPDEFENGKSKENGGGRRKMPFFIVFTRKGQIILRGSPTGKVRAFKLVQKAGDIQTPIPTAHCISMGSVPGRAAVRSIVLSRKHGKVLINSQDRVMRLYDVSQLIGCPVNNSISSGSVSGATDASPIVTIVEADDTNANIDANGKTGSGSNLDKDTDQEITADANTAELETLDDNIIDISKGDDGIVDSDHTQSKFGRKKKKARMNKPKPVDKRNPRDGPTLEPLTIFTEVVNRTQCTCACFSRDGDFVLGGMEGTEHRIQVWRTADGHLEMTLEGPKEGIIEILFHPLRPVLATLGRVNGRVYIWMKTFSENWSAFAPEFCQLEANEEYVEAEDEFDLKDPVSLEEQQAERDKAEAAKVDVETCDHSGWFSSDSDEEDTYFYVPAKPKPKANEEEAQSLAAELMAERMGHARGEKGPVLEDDHTGALDVDGTGNGHSSAIALSSGRRRRFRTPDTAMGTTNDGNGGGKTSRMRRGRNGKRMKLETAPATARESEVLAAAATVSAIQGRNTMNDRGSADEGNGVTTSIGESDCLYIEKRK